MKIFLIIGLGILVMQLSYAQDVIYKILLREHTISQNIVEANVFTSKDHTNVAFAQLDGFLVIKPKFPLDTLIIDAPGYRISYVPLKKLDPNIVNFIFLERNENILDEVVISARNPISEQFSIQKLSSLAIYLDPFSNADPLKAVNGLSSSTNTEENANPVLRGSNENRSIVIFNRVPVFNPVRNSQLNGIGNFSIFNTELINNQLIYPSNPPLTYGHSSGGLIEINTINELSNDEIQLNSNLVGAGIFGSKKLTNKSFFQLFSNYQFSSLLKTVNNKTLTNLKSFNSIDLGTNYNIKFKKYINFNAVLYGINEKYVATDQLFNNNGNTQGENKRFFSVINLDRLYRSSTLSLNTGFSFSQNLYKFGNIASENLLAQLYLATTYEIAFNKFNLHIGSSYERTKSIFKSVVPSNSFLIREEDSSIPINYILYNNNLETHAYTTYKITPKIIISSGIRNNIPFDKFQYQTEKQPSFLSYQLSLRYYLSDEHGILLSGGRYHNTPIATYYNPTFNVLKSHQLAVDYSFNKADLSLSFSSYYKKDNATSDAILAFDNYHKSAIFGIEASFKKSLFRHISYSISNTFLRQSIRIENKLFPGKNSLNYFIKASLSYNNYQIINASVSYIDRPGIYQTPISSLFIDSEDNLLPNFSNNINSYQLDSYRNVSLNINKIFSVKSISTTVYFIATNFFNKNNPRSILYYEDYYTDRSYNYFQKRLFFIGINIKL